MANTIEATYDGVALYPSEPLEFAPNTRLRIVIESVLSDVEEPPSFFRVVRSLRIDGPPDWSENHDKYIYGHLTASMTQEGDDEQPIP